jgi:hypothetical protein
VPAGDDTGTTRAPSPEPAPRETWLDLLLYVSAAAVYIPLAIFHKWLLNWVIGPLWLVMWVWTVPRLVGAGRRLVGRATRGTAA